MDNDNNFRSNTVILVLHITDMVLHLYANLEGLAWDTFVFMSPKREAFSNSGQAVIRERLHVALDYVLCDQTAHA